jgi:ech hydrogenase subunit A
LERVNHVKNIEDMKGMVARSPKTVGYILFGFVSLTLPPFGLFMGKLFAISSIASLLKEHPLYLIILLSLIIGSSLMVLLYFKVASALLSAPSDVEASEAIAIPNGYNVPLVLLSFFIVIGALGYIMMQHNIFVVLMALPMLLVFALPALIRRMDRYDRSQPYHCGEKDSFDAALVYYEPTLKVQRILFWAFGSLFVAVAIVGALS